MKIALLNGSPRGRKATSEWILNEIASKIKTHDLTHFYIRGVPVEKEVGSLLENDILVFAFPNYYGSIPAPVMELMEALEKKAQGLNENIKVYIVVNCGFYYSSENNMAIEVMKNFCKKAGFEWGRGLSIGSGGAIVVMDKIVPAKFILLPIYKAIKDFSKLVSGEKVSIKNADLSVKTLLPCRLYVFIAQSIWCAKAKKNGIKPCEM